MKMTKYLNKRIFVCLSVVVLLLIMVSFVASSGEDKENLKIMDFNQEPRGKVTREIGTFINFDWEITKKPPSYLTDHDYYLKILDASGREVYSNTFKTPTQPCSNFSGKDSWEVSPDIELGKYTSILRVPYKPPLAEFKGIEFEVVETLLVIQKFNDTNRNHDLDDGVDERLGDWEFKVTDPFGKTKKYSTDKFGEIRIEIPEGKEGDYNITEIPKDRWELVDRDTDAFIVDEDKQWIKIRVEKGKESMVKFLNIYHPPPTTTLLIQKFNDTNRNYELDDIEKLQGWEFQVTGPDGKTTTHFTDSNGEIRIGIPEGKEGNYTIEEIPNPDWEAITPTIQTLNVPKGETTTVNFSNIFRPPPILVISKFYDHNWNGERDKGEEGVHDWEFEIKFPDGSIKIVTTGPDGRYIIHDPPIGRYTITERPEPCWRNSTPMVVRDIEIKPGQGAEVEFGNYEVGTLIIYKFNDTNHNGVWEAGEVPLPNWGFKVKSADSFIDILDIPNTDENGSITVELPANLRYTVSETILVGWRNSTPHTQLVYINPCEKTKLNFGNYNYSEIIIRKFNDTNKDGIREDDEEWLAGWDFWISGPNVNKIFTTDENGGVIYRDAIPGQYWIEERIRDDQRRNGWRITTPPRTKEVVVEEGQKVELEFGNYIYCPCEDIYMPSEDAPRWHNNSDENLVVSKYVDPRIVHCDNPNPNEGEIINVTLRVCAFAGMPPTDLVIAVDTSGSLLECSGAVLDAISEGITEYIANNKAKFGENVRIGLVSWDEDIDETVNLTTDYSNVTAACKRLSINAEEDTLYPVGLNGSIGVFDRCPRENVTKMIVFITDARGTTDGLSNYSRLPDTSGYIIHAITVCTERDSDNFKMLENFTSQHSGFVRRVSESSDELAKKLTTLTVSSIERRILNNVTVIETLPKYLRVLNWTYRIPPTSPEHINRDGIDWSTETMVWDISDLSSDQCWENTFQAIFCCRMPADETHPVGIPKKTSEVTYSDPTNSSITKHMLIPEGGIWIQPRPWWERVPVWLWALLGSMAIAIIALAIYCFRRKPKQET